MDVEQVPVTFRPPVKKLIGSQTPTSRKYLYSVVPMARLELAPKKGLCKHTADVLQRQDIKFKLFLA